jgi:hypothetical protein
MTRDRSGVPPSNVVDSDTVAILQKENERLRAEVAYLKNSSLDPVEEFSCADKARLIAGLRHQLILAHLLQVAGLARSAFYYQCLATKRREQQGGMEARIRTIFDEHKGRYGYRRITAVLCYSMAEPVNY